MNASPSVASAAGVRPLADLGQRTEKTGRCTPTQYADPELVLEAEHGHERLREQMESALSQQLPPWDRAVLERLSETMDGFWVDLQEESIAPEDLIAQGASPRTEKEVLGLVAHRAQELVADFIQCTGAVERYLQSVTERSASIHSRLQEAPLAGQRGAPADGLAGPPLGDCYSASSTLASVSSAVRTVVEHHAGTTGSFQMALPRHPLSMAGLAFSAVDAGLAARDMAVHGIGVQNSADLGAAGVGLAGGLISGPLALAFSSFAAGYSTGKLIDRMFGISDAVAGVSGDFMPEDVQQWHQNGILGSVVVDALLLEARVWDEGYQWYLQTIGEYAPEAATEYSLGAAAAQRARPELRGYDDEELVAHVAELPSDLRLAIIRHMGEQACGLAGGLPERPENRPPAVRSSATPSVSLIYQTRIQP
ncbi:MAG: hypothetical protein JW797_10120 [Bradymonadales bacterium]|nr:hypothetical protein [Bradymonadales bacterium]